MQVSSVWSRQRQQGLIGLQVTDKSTVQQNRYVYCPQHNKEPSTVGRCNCW